MAEEDLGAFILQQGNSARIGELLPVSHQSKKKKSDLQLGIQSIFVARHCFLISSVCFCRLGEDGFDGGALNRLAMLQFSSATAFTASAISTTRSHVLFTRRCTATWLSWTIQGSWWQKWQRRHRIEVEQGEAVQGIRIRTLIFRDSCLTTCPSSGH